jgi:crotonobetainyl-CoA:carnitine CoA-transferase CaiB-like acyl-CoA transferase
MLVVEAGSRIQGPMAGHLLWMLGAEVIRVEPPGGDPMRDMAPLCGNHSAVWLSLNAGKRSTEIDIKSPAGRRNLLELVEAADVFLHNWAPGKAIDLGLDAAAFRGRNPDLVYAHTSGWSGAVPDPPIATDFMVQARSGVAEALRVAGEPARPTLMTVLDSLGGMLGAEAVVAGLLHKEITGHGSEAETSLLAAAAMLLAIEPATGRDPLFGPDGWMLAGTQVTTTLCPDGPGHPLAGVLTRVGVDCMRPPSPWSGVPVAAVWSPS